MRYQESSLNISYSTSAVLTNSEMKAHLRVTGTNEDSLITTYVAAATRFAENYTRLLMLPGTVTEIFSMIPGNSGVPSEFYSLKIGNAMAITSISANTTDSPEDFTAMSSANVLNQHFNKPRVYAPDGWEFGTVSPYQVKIVYAAGFADAASVPSDIKVAIMLICADMYENRMDYVKQLPTAAEILLSPYVVNQGV